MPVVTSRELHAQAAASLAEALGGSIQGEVKVAIEREGVVFTIQPFHHAEHGLDWNAVISAPLSISAGGGSAYRSDGRPAIHGRPDLELRARSLGDTLGERIGLESPLLVDETRFARLVVAESGAPRAIQQAVLAAPAARAAVLELLRAGCPSVKLQASAGILSIQVEGRSHEALAAEVARVLSPLGQLLAALPLFEEGFLRPGAVP